MNLFFFNVLAIEVPNLGSVVTTDDLRKVPLPRLAFLWPSLPPHSWFNRLCAFVRQVDPSRQSVSISGSSVVCVSLRSPSFSSERFFLFLRPDPVCATLDLRCSVDMPQFSERAVIV